MISFLSTISCDSCLSEQYLQKATLQVVHIKSSLLFSWKRHLLEILFINFSFVLFSSINVESFNDKITTDNSSSSIPLFIIKFPIISSSFFNSFPLKNKFIFLYPPLLLLATSRLLKVSFFSSFIDFFSKLFWDLFILYFELIFSFLVKFD